MGSRYCYHSGAPEFDSFFLCICLSGVCVVHVVKLHVFTFLVPCCDVRYYFRYDFRVNTMFDSSSLLHVFISDSCVVFQ